MGISERLWYPTLLRKVCSRTSLEQGWYYNSYCYPNTLYVQLYLQDLDQSILRLFVNIRDVVQPIMYVFVTTPC